MTHVPGKLLVDFFLSMTMSLLLLSVFLAVTSTYHADACTFFDGDKKNGGGDDKKFECWDRPCNSQCGKYDDNECGDGDKFWLAQTPEITAVAKLTDVGPFNDPHAPLMDVWGERRNAWGGKKWGEQKWYNSGSMCPRMLRDAQSPNNAYMLDYNTTTFTNMQAHAYCFYMDYAFQDAPAFSLGSRVLEKTGGSPTYTPTVSTLYPYGAGSPFTSCGTKAWYCTAGSCSHTTNGVDTKSTCTAGTRSYCQPSKNWMKLPRSCERYNFGSNWTRRFDWQPIEDIWFPSRMGRQAAIDYCGQFVEGTLNTVGFAPWTSTNGMWIYEQTKKSNGWGEEWDSYGNGKKDYSSFTGQQRVSSGKSTSTSIAAPWNAAPVNTAEYLMTQHADISAESKDDECHPTNVATNTDGICISIDDDKIGVMDSKDSFYHYFFCSRTVIPISFRHQQGTITDAKCYQRRWCRVYVVLPVTFSRKFSSEITWGMTVDGPAFNDAWGDKTSSTTIMVGMTENYGSVRSAYPGVAEIYANITSERGWGFRNGTYALEMLPLENITVASETHNTQTNILFQGQTYSLTVQHSTTVTPLPGITTPIQSSCLGADPCVSWSGTPSVAGDATGSYAVTWTVSPTSTIANNAVLRFAVTTFTRYWASSYWWTRYDVRAPATISSATPSAALLAGKQTTLTLSTASANPVVNEVVVDVTSTCGADLTISPASITYTAGQTNPSTVITYTAAATMASTTCTISFARTANLPQWQATIADVSLDVKGLIELTVPGWSPTMSCNTDYNFKIKLATALHWGSVTVALTCTGAVITAPTTPTFTSGGTPVTELDYTISYTCTTTATCTLGYGLVGTPTTDVDQIKTPLPTTTGSWSDLKTIVSNLATSPTYIGQTVVLSFNDGGHLIATQTITIDWTFSVGAMLNHSSGQVTLTDTLRSAKVYFLATTANSGEFSFSATVPGTFTSTMSNIPLVINALKTVTTTPANPWGWVAVGYPKTLSLSISALPAQGTLTLTPYASDASGSTYITFSPTTVSWSSADGANNAKTITYSGVTDKDPLPLKVGLSGTVIDFDLSTGIDLGNGRVFTKINVNASVTNVTLFDVAGSTKSFTLDFDKSFAQAMTIDVAVPGTIVSLATAATMSFGAGTTSMTVTLNKVAIGTGTTTFALGSAETADKKKEFETLILPVDVTVRAARTMNFTCNDTQLYFGPGWVLKCTATILEAPSTGSFKAETADPTTGIFTFTQVPYGATTATSLGTFSPSVLTIDFYVVPTLTPVAITDGNNYNVKVNLYDTSASFDTTVINVPIKCLKLNFVTLSVVTTGNIYVGMQFTVEATTTVVPTENLTVTPGPTTSLSWSDANFVLYNDTTGTPMKVQVNVTASAAGTFSLQFGVAGSVKFAPQSLTASQLVRPLVSISITPTPGTMINLYAGQTETINVAAATSPLAGTNTGFTPVYYCNGAPMPGAVTFTPTSDTWAPGTSSSDFVVTSVSACHPNTGKVFFARNGSSIIYSEMLNSSLTTRALKSMEIAPTNYIVYGGNINSTTIRMSVGALPLCAGCSLTVNIQNNRSDIFHITGGNLGADGVQYNDVDPAIEANKFLTGKADTVSSPQYVFLNLTLAGTALSEYYVVRQSVVITVMPTVNVSVSDTLINDKIIFVGGGFARLVRVTLPQLPEGTGSVTVTPNFLYGSLSNVEFTPTSAVLDSTTSFVDFNVTALVATSGAEAIKFTYTGTASEYFPQPDSQEYPVTFQARGSFSVSNIPASLFRSFTQDIAITALYAPPAGYASVTVNVVPQNADITASPASVTWSTGDTVLEQTVTLTGVNINAAVVVDFTVSGPAIYFPNPNPATATIAVLDEKAVIFTMPSFVYVNGISVAGTVEIVALPRDGKDLKVIPAVTVGIQALSFVPSTVTFTDSTAKSQPIAITATTPTTPVEVSINLQGAAGDDGDYEAPVPIWVEIRARETMVETGLPSELYVGQSATVTVTFSRLPIKTGTFVELTPSFGSSSAAFFPTSIQWKADGTTPLAQSFTFTATGTTVSPVAVSWAISGTNTEIFETAVQMSTSNVMIYPKEVVSITTAANLTDGTGGFTYQFNSLPLNVSLGSPKISHTGVTVNLDYAGGSSRVVFTPASVVFPPGVNWIMVDLYAALTSTNAPILATIPVGSGDDVFDVGTMPSVRLLPRIEVTCDFDPDTKLMVVNRTTQTNIFIASAALVGDLQVCLSYGTEITMSGCVDFLGGTLQLSKIINMFGFAESATKNITMSFSGTGSSFYTTSKSGFPTPVLLPKQVLLSVVPPEVYIGTMNRDKLIFNLSALPTLGSDAITITLTESTNFAFVGATSGTLAVTLNAGSPSAVVEVEGLLPGVATMTNFMAVVSNSQEYLDNVGLMAPLTSSNIRFRVRQAVTSPNYVSKFFTSQTRVFTFVLPQLPTKGTLTLTPSLVGAAGYTVTYVPATLVFSTTPGSNTSAQLSITADTLELAGAQLRLTATGSTDFLDVPFQQPFDVIDATLVVVSGVPAFMYPGSINTVQVTVAISKPPDGNLTVLIMPTPGSYLAFTPNTVFYNATTPLDQSVNLRATNYQPELANFTLNLTELPTPYFRADTQPSVSIRAPDTVTAALSTLVVYHGTSLTITITLSTAPTSDLVLDLVLKKNQTGTGKTMVELTPAEVNVPQSQLNLFGQTTATYTATALVSPLPVEVSFLISGPAAKTFQPQELLPKFLIHFTPLRKIYVTVPPVMYLGLMAPVNITLEKTPDQGSVQVTAVPATMLGWLSSISFTWTSGDTVPMRSFECVPDATGLGDVQFSILASGTVAYETTTINVWNSAPESTIYVTVKNPTVIGLGTLPPNVFYGSANAINIPVTITGDALVTGEDDVYVLLESNSSSQIVMNPASGALNMPLTSGVFTVYATEPCTVYFNLTFASKLNRFVLDPAAKFVEVTFRPLKQIKIIPPLTEYIVGQPVPYTVSIDEKPEPGHALIANLIYSGSPGNVELPASIGWTSASTASDLAQFLVAKGLSTTGVQLLSVSFSGDPQYNMTQFDWPMKFNPKLNLVHNFPTSVFYNRSTANLTITTEAVMNVTIEFTTSPVDSFVFTPSKLSWQPGDTLLTLPITLRAVKVGPTATIKFNLVGPDASKFNLMSDFGITIVSSEQILIIAPSSAMIVFLKPGMTVRVGVAISEPAHGDLYIQPTWSGCAAGFANFTVQPLHFTPSSPTVMYTDIFGVFPSKDCALQFPLSGVTAPFVGTSNLYSVTVRPLYLISLTLGNKRVFRGPANKVPISINIDADLGVPGDKTGKMKPPEEQIVANFWTTEPCLSLNPTSLTWAKLSDTEKLTKEIFVTADIGPGCPVLQGASVNLAIHCNVSTISTIYNITVPPTIYVNAWPLLIVDAQEAEGNVKSFFMWVGDTPLTFIVSLPEPLEPTEGMEVKPLFAGLVGSVNALSALWSPSPVQKLSQFAIVSAITISPESALDFEVFGPPRFEKWATGNGTLEIFGPLTVVAKVDGTLIATRNYSIPVTLQDTPLPDVTITVTPVWIGDARAMLFDPPVLTFQFGQPLTKHLTLAALEPSGAYRLRFVVTGSRRFVESAFDGLVAIRAPTVISHRSLPQQLMMGQSYTLYVDLGSMPPTNDELYIKLDAENFFLAECVSLSPSTLMMSTNVGFPTTILPVTVTPVFDGCNTKMFDIRFTVYGNASYAYNRTVVTRKFQTIPAASLAVSWTSESYVGKSNAPELLLTLYSMPTGLDNVTIKLEQVPIPGVNMTNISFPETVMWTSSSPSSGEKNLLIYAHSEGAARIRFSVLHAPAGFSYTPEEYTVTFYPLLRISRTAIPSSFYQNDKNKILVTINLTAPIRTLQNQQPVELTVVPTSKNDNLVFQPAVLTWSPEQRTSAIMYVTGITPGQDNITFAFSGSGRYLLENTLPHQETEVLPLILITFSLQEPILYVGAANTKIVRLQAPSDPAPMRVTVEVEGDSNALKVSPTEVVWFAFTPREQKVTMLGMYGSPVQCLLRYRMIEGPPNIDVKDSRGSPTTLVTALRKVTHIPTVTRFSFPEDSKFTLTFSPNQPVVCTFTPNITNATTNFADNSTLIHLLTYGLSTAKCIPTDSTYAELAPFVIDATPLKRFTIFPSVVNTFINTTNYVDISVSSSPEGGTMTVRPDMTGLDSFFSLKPKVVLYTSTSALTTRIVFTGKNLTGGPRTTSLLLSGPIAEFYTKGDALDFAVDVRAPIQLFSKPSSLMNQTMVDGMFITFINAENGGIWDFSITGSPLKGPITVTLASDNADLIFSPNILVFGTKQELLTKQVKVWSTVPIGRYAPPFSSTARMTAAITGPQEYVGVTSIDLGRIIIKPLLHITALDTLPKTMYVGLENQKRLDIQLSGFPRPGQIVAVLVTASCDPAVKVAPPVIEWQSNYDNPSEVLTKSVDVTGITKRDSCDIKAEWLVRANKVPASNFDTSVVDSVKKIIVANIIGFKLTSPQPQRENNYTDALPGAPLDGGKVPISSFTMYNSPANGRPITITLDGIPADATREAEMRIFVDCIYPPPPPGVNINNCAKDIFVITPRTITFGALADKGPEDKGPFKERRKATLDVYAKPGTEGNATIYFELVKARSTSEYSGGLFLPVLAIVKPLLTFQVIGLRHKFAMGIENKITFQVQPALPCTLTTIISMTCPEVTATPAQLIWGASREAQDIELVSPAAVTDKDTCRVTVQTSGGVSQKAFVAQVVNEPVQVIDRPTLVFWEKTIKYSDIKVGTSFFLSLTGEGDFEFREPKDQVADPDSVDNSTIAFTSTATSKDTGVLNKIKHEKNFIEFRYAKDSQARMQVLLGPSPKFSLDRAETLTIKVRRSALKGDEALERKKDIVKLTITGQAEEFAASAQAIESGISGAVVALAAMSLHTSLFAGRVLGAMDLVYCPDPEWRMEQKDLGWYRQLIPMPFDDDVNSLGTYASIGTSTLIVMLAFLVGHLIFAYAIYRYRANGTAWDKSFGAALAFVWFPSLQFFPPLFFYQFTVAASLRTIMYAPGVGMRFAGAVGFLLLGFGVPIALLMRVVPGFHAKWYTSERQFMKDIKELEEKDKAKTGGNTLPGAKKPATAAGAASDDKEAALLGDAAATGAMSPKSAAADNNSDDDEAKAAIKAAEEEEEEAANRPTGLMRLFVASGFWRNPADIYWVNRYGMLFDSYSEKFKTWLIFETIFSFVLGALDGIEPVEPAWCSAKASVMIAMYFGLMVIFIIFRPFRRSWLNMIISFCYFLMFLAVTLLADSVFRGLPAGRPSAATEFGYTVLMFHSALLILIAVLLLVLGLAELLGVEKLFQLRKTGRVDGARNMNDNVATEEEMKAQMERDDFTKLMAEHSKQQAIEHRVAEKKHEFEERTKSQVRQVVHADQEANPFAKPAQKQQQPAQEWNDEDLDFI